MILSIDVIEEKLDQGEDGETSVSVHTEPGVYQDHHPALCLAAIHSYHLSRLVSVPPVVPCSLAHCCLHSPGVDVSQARVQHDEPNLKVSECGNENVTRVPELGPCAAELTTRSLLGNSQAGPRPGTPETEIS